MKKFLVLLLLMAIGISVYAQKCYVNIIGFPYNDSGSIYLNGAVPSDMNSSYSTSTAKMGDVLNMLAERGFVIEQMSCSYNGHTVIEVVIMSTSSPSGQTISKGDVNTDGEVNIADVNEVINLILGYVREHPEILEQYGK